MHQKNSGVDLYGKKKKNLFLKIFLNDVGSLDLGFCGKSYTWTNGKHGLALIKERLDRAVADERWVIKFPKATEEHLTMELSDHCPIMVSTGGRIPFVRRPFRFVKAWASDKSSFKVVENAWKRLENWNGMALVEKKLK